VVFASGEKKRCAETGRKRKDESSKQACIKAFLNKNINTDPLKIF